MYEFDTMSGLEFEHYLAKVYKSLGYKVHITPASNDYGADLILMKDNQIIAVQAKCTNSNMGSRGVQEVIGSLKYYSAHKGMVVGTSYFTKNAINLAAMNDIELVDRDRLISILKQASTASGQSNTISTIETFISISVFLLIISSFFTLMEFFTDVVLPFSPVYPIILIIFSWKSLKYLLRKREESKPLLRISEQEMAQSVETENINEQDYETLVRTTDELPEAIKLIIERRSSKEAPYQDEIYPKNVSEFSNYTERTLRVEKRTITKDMSGNFVVNTGINECGFDFPPGRFRITSPTSDGDILIKNETGDTLFEEYLTRQDNFDTSPTTVLFTFNKGDLLHVIGINQLLLSPIDGRTSGMMENGYWQVGRDIDPGKYSIKMIGGDGELQIKFTNGQSIDECLSMDPEWGTQQVRFTVATGDEITITGCPRAKLTKHY